MWPSSRTVPPEVSALNLVLCHLKEIRYLELQLATCSGMVLVQSGLKNAELTDIRVQDWVEFRLPTPATSDHIKSRYGLPVGTPMPIADATRLFIEVKTLAIELNNWRCIMYRNKDILSDLTGFFTSGTARIGMLEGEVDGVIERWMDRFQREEELQGWTGRVEALKQRVEAVVYLEGDIMFEKNEAECHGLRRRGQNNSYPESTR